MNQLFDMSTLSGTVHAAKIVARRYRDLTGKPLGITGEVGEVQAALLLGLTLTEARQPGYDAIAPDGRRIQIKTRCLIDKRQPGQRIGAIDLKHDWDIVLLLIMDKDYEPLEAFEAPRNIVDKELRRPGSKARTERGAIAVSKFKAIGRRVWPGETK